MLLLEIPHSQVAKTEPHIGFARSSPSHVAGAVIGLRIGDFARSLNAITSTAPIRSGSPSLCIWMSKAIAAEAHVSPDGDETETTTSTSLA